MTLYTPIFYLLAATMVISTAVAVTRRNLAHAVVYLVLSFFGSALLFYLLGAPLLAALEVIIYAGAIMILFLFVVMMIRLDADGQPMMDRRQALPAMAIAAVYLVVGALVIAAPHTGPSPALTPAVATPKIFGHFVFDSHWLAIEAASMLLLVVLVGALLIGRRPQAEPPEESS